MRVAPLEGNVHLLAATSIFGSVEVPKASVAGLRNLVLICFTNRSGSWLLADLLGTSGRFFVAGECLNGDEVANIAQRRRIRSFAGFFEEYLVGQAVDGNLVLKCGLPHLEILGRSGVLDHLGARVRYVHVERLDRLAQAISWEIARQTQHWSSHRSHLPAPEPVYDRAGIEAAIELFAGYNHGFGTFFGLNGIVPEHVTYEALVARPAEVAEGVVAGMFAGPAGVDPAKVTFRRQAGPRNEEWRRRFLAE
jgi:LPS sulfotransferase NodH